MWLVALDANCHAVLKIAYHDYQGVVLNNEEKASLLKDLGHGEALILRNHGALTVGKVWEKRLTGRTD